MLYKRHKNEYERIIMNDDWVKQKCCECKYYDICTHTHVLAPSSLDLGYYEPSRNSMLFTINEICTIYKKSSLKSPKILYSNDPKTKKDS